MKLPEYDNLTSKMQYFEGEAMINTKQQFIDFYNKNKKLPNSISRGVNEAKYKLFTSVQRSWIGLSLSEHFSSINELVLLGINNLKKENLIKKYYKSLGVEVNDFLYLSLLQHYGTFSPFLDFSYSLNTSLFFAIDDMVCGKSYNEIDDYISVYFIDYVNSLIKFKGFSRYLQSGLDNGKNLLKQISNDESKALNIRSLTNIGDVLSFEKLSTNCNFIFMDNSSKSKKIKTPFLGQLFTLNNLNIVAQNGCFVYYLNEEIPFEVFYKETTGYKLRCYNIHKSLAGFIIKYIGNITKEDVYPDLNKIVKKSVDKTLRDL